MIFCAIHAVRCYAFVHQVMSFSPSTSASGYFTDFPASDLSPLSQSSADPNPISMSKRMDFQEDHPNNNVRTYHSILSLSVL